MSHVRIVCTLLFLLGACVPKAPRYNYAMEPDPRKSEYVIGVGDEVMLSVRADSSLSSEMVVRPDGTITVPLVGDFVAAGETPTALKAKIRAKLIDFVKIEGPELTVSITGVNSYHFTVSGEVQNAGVFHSAYYVTALDALALAGGFTRFASRNDIKLMRRDSKLGTVRSIPLVYDLMASGKRPDMNIIIVAGDTIYVP